MDKRHLSALVFFSIYFIFEIIWHPGIYWPGVLACCLLAGHIIIDLLPLKKAKKKEVVVVEAPPEIVVNEDLQVKLNELGAFLQDHELELRVKRAEKNWNVTFLRGGRVPQIVGAGSASSIENAVIKAEADFLERG